MSIKQRYAIRSGGFALFGSTKRVKATGNLGRLLILPLSLMVATLGLTGFFVWGEPFLEKTMHLQLVLVVCSFVGLYTLIRSPFWGVRLGDDSVIVISWWRSYRIPFDEVFAIRHVEYEGLIVGVGDPIFGSRLRMICFKLHNGDELNFPGTLFRRGNATKILQPLKAAMDIRHPTRP